MLFSTVKRNDTLYLCCQGSVNTYEEYVEFAQNLDELIDTHIHTDSATFSQWCIMLLDALPFNTYALGHLLRLKLHNHYHFRLATNTYRLLDLLESVEFHKIFAISVERDPRSYKNT